MLIETIKEIRKEAEALFEMANLSTKSTGLPYVISISSKNANHSARIKIAKERNHFICSVTVEEQRVIGKCDLKQKEINKIKKWVKLNKEALLELWEYRITFDEFIKKVKGIK